MNPAIRVTDLSKQYKLGSNTSLSLRGTFDNFFNKNQKNASENSEFWALRDVSFEINQGDSVGIIGKNGAGKSTLLKILSRITEPTSGEIIINGRVASLLEVGTGFHSELTGRENIFLNGTILGMKKAEIKKKFDEIVDFSGIEKFIDTPVKRYSSGMYVRLAFAVAAHLEPEILIVDEVLAVGDAEFQKKCLGKMGEVTEKQGRTVLFVSHSMPAITTLCKKVILLDKGTMKFNGDVNTGKDIYLSIGIESNTVKFREFKRNENLAYHMKSANLLFNNSEKKHFEMGDSLSIEVNFDSDIDLLVPTLGLAIYDKDLFPVITTNNFFIPTNKINYNKRNGRILCDFGKIPLNEGNYSIKLWFSQGESGYQIEEYALSFNVEAKDIWGLGKLPPKNAPIWWNATYNLNS